MEAGPAQSPPPPPPPPSGLGLLILNAGRLSSPALINGGAIVGRLRHRRPARSLAHLMILMVLIGRRPEVDSGIPNSMAMFISARFSAGNPETDLNAASWRGGAQGGGAQGGGAQGGSGRRRTWDSNFYLQVHFNLIWNLESGSVLERRSQGGGVKGGRGGD